MGIDWVLEVRYWSFFSCVYRGMLGCVTGRGMEGMGVMVSGYLKVEKGVS
jgi:hypothetical protein